MKRFHRLDCPLLTRVYVLMCLLMLTACTLGETASPADFTQPMPSATPQPTPTTAVENGWQSLRPGLQQRTLNTNEGAGSRLIAVRVDPANYSFRAHYRPGERLSLGDWRDALQDAAVIINSNFFTEGAEVLGLLVSDGTGYGSAYTSRGGMFTVQDGRPAIRSNTLSPYQGETLEQAVQAFPMLVVDGRQAYSAENDRVRRRSAIAQDASGRIILLVTPGLGITLTDLSAFLANSDMNVISAFNLDGGGSTMLHVAPSDTSISTFDAVPAVLAAYPR